MTTPDAACRKIATVAFNYASKVKRSNHGALPSGVELPVFCKTLGWILMHYEQLHRTGRIYGNACNSNPKDLILQFEDELGADYGAIFYDAWGIGIANEHDMPDVHPKLPHGGKLGLTYEEWLELKASPLYRYHDLYGGREDAIINELLLSTNGHWKTYGDHAYIAYTGPSDTDDALFAGYSRFAPEAKLAAKVKSAFLNNRAGTKAEKHLATALANSRKLNNGYEFMHVRRGEDYASKLVKLGTASAKGLSVHTLELLKMLKSRERDTKPYQFTAGWEGCALSVMPDNAHPSYPRAAMRICRMIKKAPKKHGMEGKATLKIIDKFLDVWKKRGY